MSLIECVPNLSEGRRTDVVERLADAIRAAKGVRLLDYSADRSHNRSVFTMAGDAAGLEAAILGLYERAILDIDLRAQRGEHPRLGAVDVVPFVPLAGATMDECVQLAKQVGARVAERFHVPVYLYEEAATHPSRRRLDDIRRGGFEGLAARMAAPEWAPDFGPSQPHPSAGASVVGARMPLIAFNVNLASDRLDAARRIAAAVRERTGGLPGVKALGLRLEERGIVQVSMNLTNYERTSMRDAFDAVKREADREGIVVLESEIIGLVPAAAVTGLVASELKLRDFSNRQILERQLERTGTKDQGPGTRD